MWYTAYRFRLPPTSGMWLVLFKLGHQGQQRYGPQSTQAGDHFSHLFHSNTPTHSRPVSNSFYSTAHFKAKLRNQDPKLASDSNHSTSTEILLAEHFYRHLHTSIRERYLGKTCILWFHSTPRI